VTCGTEAERPRGAGLVATIVILSCGGLVTVVTAALTAMSTADAVELALIAAGAAVVGASGGVLALRLARGRAVATQSAIAAFVALLSVVVGILVAADTMFLSREDLGALTVILAASSTVAAVAAVFVGARVGRASDTLVESARRIGAGEVDLGRPEDLPHELARLHDELTRAAARLDEGRTRERALEHSRRELVAWVSHDLRTPLAGIRALAEALEDGVVTDPETVARYHGLLRIEADRLSGLVDDLFELSRTQAGVLRLEVEPVALEDLVSDAIASAAPMAAAKGVRLVGRVAGPVPDVPASTPEMLRVLRNVLENAIRHTPSDGTVSVETGVEHDEAYVTVLDSGGGISSRDLPHVFEVAYRGDPARTPGDGAGLGLAIARGLVEAHDGRITVRNQNGGACFTLRLPTARASEP
jgi:signal transduction histidine kinase